MPAFSFSGFLEVMITLNGARSALIIGITKPHLRVKRAEPFVRCVLANALHEKPVPHVKDFVAAGGQIGVVGHDQYGALRIFGYSGQ